MLHLTVTTMPSHIKTNPVQVSLLGFEAVVLVTKYLAHLIKQALGLGKIHPISVSEAQSLNRSSQMLKANPSFHRTCVKKPRRPVNSDINQRRRTS